MLLCKFIRKKSSHINSEFGHSGQPAEDEIFIFFGGTFNSVDVVASFAKGKCSNIECHSATNELNWYNEAAGCTTSYHIAGTKQDPLVSGKHPIHVGDSGILC